MCNMTDLTVRIITPSEASTLLRSYGLRATRGRVETLIYLASHPEPVTHKDVVQDFGEAQRATVFRILKDFARVRLAVRADLGDHLWRFWYGPADRFDLISGLRNVPIAC